ncbi:MAG: hypothetical protein OEO77_03900 [Acidimicrobiia bacterium]|nr:hypothetical protein [Acidimicrobiia bacterium]
MVLAQSEVSSFVDGIESGLRNAWADVIEFAPKLIGALLILFIGWMIARVIRTVFKRVFEGVGLDRLLDRAGLAGTLQSAGYTASELVSNIVYWIALLIVFLLAAEALGVDALTDLLSGLIAYLPLVIVAIVIVVVAAAVGSFVAEVVRPWATQQGIAWLAPATRWGLIIFGVFAALSTLNVAQDIVNTLFIAVLASVGVAFAVAFGVGGIRTAEKYWQRMLPGGE